MSQSEGIHYISTGSPRKKSKDSINASPYSSKSSLKLVPSADPLLTDDAESTPLGPWEGVAQMAHSPFGSDGEEHEDISQLLTVQPLTQDDENDTVVPEEKEFTDTASVAATEHIMEYQKPPNTSCDPPAHRLVNFIVQDSPTKPQEKHIPVRVAPIKCVVHSLHIPSQKEGKIHESKKAFEKLFLMPSKIHRHPTIKHPPQQQQELVQEKKQDSVGLVFRKEIISILPHPEAFSHSMDNSEDISSPLFVNMATLAKGKYSDKFSAQYLQKHIWVRESVDHVGKERDVIRFLRPLVGKRLSRFPHKEEPFLIPGSPDRKTNTAHSMIQQGPSVELSLEPSDNTLQSAEQINQTDQVKEQLAEYKRKSLKSLTPPSARLSTPNADLFDSSANEDLMLPRKFTASSRYQSSKPSSRQSLCSRHLVEDVQRLKSSHSSRSIKSSRPSGLDDDIPVTDWDGNTSRGGDTLESSLRSKSISSDEPVSLPMEELGLDASQVTDQSLLKESSLTEESPESAQNEIPEFTQADNNMIPMEETLDAYPEPNSQVYVSESLTNVHFTVQESEATDMMDEEEALFEMDSASPEYQITPHARKPLKKKKSIIQVVLPKLPKPVFSRQKHTAQMKGKSPVRTLIEKVHHNGTMLEILPRPIKKPPPPKPTLALSRIQVLSRTKSAATATVESKIIKSDTWQGVKLRMIHV